MTASRQPMNGLGFWVSGLGVRVRRRWPACWVEGTPVHQSHQNARGGGRGRGGRGEEEGEEGEGGGGPPSPPPPPRTLPVAG